MDNKDYDIRGDEFDDSGLPAEHQRNGQIYDDGTDPVFTYRRQTYEHARDSSLPAAIV